MRLSYAVTMAVRAYLRYGTGGLTLAAWAQKRGVGLSSLRTALRAAGVAPHKAGRPFKR